jgi:hypothetical protein
LRFLIKAHKFLDIQPFAKYSKDSEYGNERVLAGIYAGYKERLLHEIRGVLIWLLKANVYDLKDLEQLAPSSIIGRLWSRDKCPPGRTLMITKYKIGWHYSPRKCIPIIFTTP